jgi:hypothetical protein
MQTIHKLENTKRSNFIDASTFWLVENLNSSLTEFVVNEGKYEMELPTYKMYWIN